MASIAIKEVQAHSEGLQIEFDVHLGISLNDTDLETDQFKLSLRVKFMGGTINHISRRWQIKLHETNDKPLRFDLPCQAGQLFPQYAYEYFGLPEDLDSVVGVEKARQIRAVAALVQLTGQYVEKSHEEFIKSADGQERDIHIKIPIVVDYEIFLDGAPHIKDYLDTISLENCIWGVEAVLESDVTRAKDTSTFCREVQYTIDGKPIDEETGEFI